ncbi:MAG: DUF1800 domain-containing protein, partial [Deltaproteobacteria bacterium]|nr:DUF1800 domain-containing protein [Deltaproteobacteria bacterium]
FAFVPSNHDTDAQTLFSGANLLTVGQGAGTATDVSRGEALLAHLAAHPATKDHICRKLVTRLSGREPGPVVGACKAAWGTSGDLGQMLQAILVRPEMWKTASYRLQIKNPFELVISGHRAVWNTTLVAPLINRARDLVESMGQHVSMIPPPTGYPDTKSGWAGAGTIIAWHEYLFERMPTVAVPVSLDGAVSSSGAALEQTVRALLLTNPTATELDDIVDDIKLGLGLPPQYAYAQAGMRKTLVEPDLTNGSVLRPVRTAIHGLLATPQFLRK